MVATAAPQQVDEREFRECEACASQPGAPVLCSSCLHNRRAIALLTTRRNSTSKMQAAWSAVALWMASVVALVSAHLAWLAHLAIVDWIVGP